ncbi:MAG: GAF domain-containing protein, partial [Holophagales bacterium]|nr:GAF domain-containing protein [Holophagales bacterium]
MSGFPGRPLALLVGFGPSPPRALRELPELRLVHASASESEELLAAERVTILALGSELAGKEGLGLLTRACPSAGEAVPRILVLAAGAEPEIYLPWVQRGLIYFLSSTPPAPQSVAELLLSAARGLTQEADSTTEAEAQDLLGLTRRLAAAESVAALSAEATASIPIYLEADRAICWIYEAKGERLWCQQKNGEIRHASAALGLVSFIQRTAEAIATDRLDQDPRHDLDVDDPDGGADGGARFLGVPVARQGGPVAAVLAALRSASSPPFTDRDRHRLSQLAGQLAPILERRALDATSVAEESQIFRQRAMAHYARGQDGEGRLLEMSPVWQIRTYRLLLATVAVASLFTVFGRHYQYARGPAAVLAQGHRDVTSRLASTVAEVAVEPGQAVSSGQVLARFSGEQQASRAEALGREIDTLLLDRLR